MSFEPRIPRHWVLLSLLVVWPFPTHALGQVGTVLQGKSGLVFSVSFHPDGKLLASNVEGATTIWDLTAGKEKIRLNDNIYLRGGNRSSFSPDGKLLADVGLTTPARVYDTSTWKQRHSLEGFNERMVHLAFSADSKLLAASGVRQVCLWEMSSGRLVDSMRPASDHLGPVAFSPNGRTLAVAAGSRIVLWDLQQKRPRVVVDGHKEAVRALAFSPDGKVLASSARFPERAVALWDPITGKSTGRMEFPLGMGPANALVFSPDGQTLAVAGEACAVLLCDVDGARVRRVLTPTDTNFVSIFYSAAFSPDGQTLATGGVNGWIYLWDCRKRTPEQREKERIQGLVAGLNGDWALADQDAARALRRLGPRAVPFLKSRLKELEPFEDMGSYVRNPCVRIRNVLEYIARERDMAPGKIGPHTVPLCVDQLVEQLTSGRSPSAADWRLLTDIAQATARRCKLLCGYQGNSGEFLKGQEINEPVLRRADFVRESRVIAKEIFVENLIKSLVVCRGSLHVKGVVHDSIILANGDVEVGSYVESSLIIAAGRVYSSAGAVKSVILSRASVAGDAESLPFRESLIEQNEASPLGLFRFFDPAELGVEAADVKGAVRIQKLAANSPLARSGVKAGDLILTVDGSRCTSKDAFRQLLRRGVVQGHVVIGLRRATEALSVRVVFDRR